MGKTKKKNNRYELRKGCLKICTSESDSWDLSNLGVHSPNASAREMPVPRKKVYKTTPLTTFVLWASGLSVLSHITETLETELAASLIDLSMPPCFTWILFKASCSAPTDYHPLCPQTRCPEHTFCLLVIFLGLFNFQMFPLLSSFHSISQNSPLKDT